MTHHAPDCPCPSCVAYYALPSALAVTFALIAAMLGLLWWR